jgi:hypothetical protein
MRGICHPAKCIWCALILGSAISFGQENDAALRDRFLKAVPESARQLESLSLRSKCVVTSSWESISDEKKKLYKEVKKEFKQDHTVEEFSSAIYGSLTLQTGTRRGIGYVMAQNPFYVFRMTRASDVIPYSLEFLEQAGTLRPELKANVRQIVAEARLRPLNTWYFFSEPLDVVIRDPSFKLAKVFAVEQDGGNYVRADFDYSHPGERTRDFTDAFVMLDPDHHWAIKESGATQSESGAVHHTTMSFGDSVNGFPIPKAVTQRVWPKNDPESVFSIVANVEMTNEELTDTVFYLSHYGLPEPNFTRSWWGAWTWYLVVGVLCLGIGAIIIKRRKARG